MNYGRWHEDMAKIVKMVRNQLFYEEWAAGNLSEKTAALRRRAVSC